MTAMAELHSLDIRKVSERTGPSDVKSRELVTDWLRPVTDTGQYRRFGERLLVEANLSGICSFTTHSRFPNQSFQGLFPRFWKLSKRLPTA